MSETTLIEEEENNEPTPYQNNYRKDLAIDDDEAESLDLGDVQGASKNTSGLVENKEQEHDWKKRYSDLKRYHDTKQNEWKQQQELAEAKLAAQQSVPNELPKTPEELESFKHEYPEIFSVMQSVSQLEASSRVNELEKHIEHLKENELKAQEQVAEQELLVRHPDFMELKDTQEFMDWLSVQPENISDGLYKNKSNVDWASRVIDLYKLETDHSRSKPKSRKKQDASAAVTKTRTATGNQISNDKKIWTSSEISKLKPHEFEKLEKEIDKASREGRII